MIIDTRTQILPSDEPEFDVCSPTHAAHAHAMGCISVSIVHGWRSDRLGVDTPPESIATFVEQDPSRRVGFAGVDPLADSAGEDLERARELGLPGVTLCPADQGCRPTHDSCLAVLEHCAGFGVPVLAANPWLHDRRSAVEFARPTLWDEALRSLPALTLVLGDLGAGWIDEALLLAARHERVYVELSGVIGRSWPLYQTLQAAIERRVAHKLLFGSGFPRQTPEAAIERLYSVNTLRQGAGLPAVPRECLRAIVERDALACLGIDHLGAGRRTPAQPVVHITAETDAALVARRING